MATTPTASNKLVAQKTHYTSRPVDIPESFLQTPPSAPITFRHVPFADSALPEYAGCLAVVLDNVLAEEECGELLRLAEASSDDAASPWRPALVNVGGGFEVSVADYRNSDRIIWDSQAVVDRIWQRCLLARGEGEGESIAGMLSETPGNRGGGRWAFERLNERMRFLKYTNGQFFKPHCDGKYGFVEDGVEFETHYTLHLYLNDSAAAEGGDGCVGGATSFLSQDLTRRLDVEPKAGSVLIFQHRGLLHQGAEVLGGTKYTMRTDIVYRWVPE
ncbi:oxidoreductase domain containing protein [Cordyceps fumosorosea ARSEF 2679]|uniref:Oxidoreductase domain containing protein n=1 Tax=Cordyceps fumosorosea (strain ARSEF 2679) TaxID=1081104 RepID=A0A162LQV0_CORFA|nr:oxidoreductase domain containing protein [Cordyceps fumosorosea ARSEF 2679]OAA74244.1 oxidoreductase domain containing protein [Cordyceps fumosorosea ARSEF 2679]